MDGRGSGLTGKISIGLKKAFISKVPDIPANKRKNNVPWNTRMVSGFGSTIEF